MQFPQFNAQFKLKEYLLNPLLTFLLALSTNYLFQLIH